MFFRRSRPGAWLAGAGLALALAAALPAPAGAQAAASIFHTVWTTSDGAPAEIRQIAQDANGWLWLASASGLYRFDGERFERMAAIDGNKLRRNAIVSVATLDGGLWVGYQGGGLELFRDGVATYYDEASGLPRVGVTQLVQARGGLVSAATANGLFEWNGKRWNFAWPGGKLAQDVPVQALYVGTDNALLISTTRDGASELLRRPAGTHRFEPVPSAELANYARRDELPRRDAGSDKVIASFKDREGNLWLGTNGGLERLRPNRAHTLALPREARRPLVVPLAQGAAYIADADSGPLLRVAPDGAVDDHGLADVRLAIAGRNGAVWAASTSAVTLLSGGAPQTWELPSTSSQPQSMAEDTDGGLWLALQGRRDLLRLHEGKWVNHREMMGYPEPAVLLHVDAKDRLWQTYADSRLAVVDGSVVTRYSAKDGLRTGDITSIATRGDTVWVGGEAALMLLREGSFVAVTARDGSDFVGVTGIVVTAQGELWLQTLQGVTHISAAEVQRVVMGGAPQVAFERFDARDGIVGHASPTQPLPTLHEGPDGLIWYSTASSVGWIDPRHAGRAQLAPPLVLRSLATAAGVFAPVANMRLPEGTQDVRIDYAAPLLSTPERLRFRYKLDGVDADWVDAGARRSAIYTGLDAGDYHFQVQAVSESGVWNSAGASEDFSIAPTLVQTLWFRLACVAGVLAALALLHRWRLKQQGSRLRTRMVARLDERTRIAREVHDTLVEPVQALMAKVRDASGLLAPQAPVRGLLDAALAEAEGGVAQSASRLRELRSRAEGRELRTLFEAVGREVGGEAGAALDVQITGDVRTLAPGVGGELFHIGREAIVNAYRHAAPSKVTLSLDYGRKELRLTVSDDGAGIPDAAIGDTGATGHWGMPGMRERAGRLGAAIVWRRLPGGGTECLLAVRGKKAYDHQRGAWRRWQR